MEGAEEAVEEGGDFGPGEDWDIGFGMVCDHAGEGWGFEEGFEQGGVVVCKKRIAAILEDEICATVESDIGLFPAKVFLEFGVAILIGGTNEGVGLTHDVELLLFGNEAEKAAIRRSVAVEIGIVASREIEFDFRREALHCLADIGGTFPVGLIAGIDDLEGTLKAEGLFGGREQFDRIGAVWDIGWLDIPGAAACLQESLKGDNVIGACYDEALHGIHEDSSGPSEAIAPDVAVGVIPAMDDGGGAGGGAGGTGEEAAEERIEGGKGAVGIDDIGLEGGDCLSESRDGLRGSAAGPCDIPPMRVVEVAHDCAEGIGLAAGVFIDILDRFIPRGLLAGGDQDAVLTGFGAGRRRLAGAGVGRERVCGARCGFCRSGSGGCNGLCERIEGCFFQGIGPVAGGGEDLSGGDRADGEPLPKEGDGKESGEFFSDGLRWDGDAEASIGVRPEIEASAIAVYDTDGMGAGEGGEMSGGGIVGNDEVGVLHLPGQFGQGDGADPILDARGTEACERTGKRAHGVAAACECNGSGGMAEEPAGELQPDGAAWAAAPVAGGGAEDDESRVPTAESRGSTAGLGVPTAVCFLGRECERERRGAGFSGQG